MSALARSPDFVQPAEEAGGTSEILTFRLGTGVFGVDVRRVREVLDYKPISPMPNAPSSLLGMIDVRGSGVPVVDLKQKLRMPGGFEPDVGTDTRIVVLEFDTGGRTRTIAIVADAVHEVSGLADQRLEAPPEFGEPWSNDFMRGLGRRGESFLTLLEIEKLFGGSDGGSIFQF